MIKVRNLLAALQKIGPKKRDRGDMATAKTTRELRFA